MREYKYEGVAVAVILLLIAATQTTGAAIQSVAVWSAPPNITSFAPPSPVYNNEGETRTFDISINQIVNVSWLINGTKVFTEYGVNESVYTNSAVAGTWNVSAIASNSEGTAMHRWTWNVTHAPPRRDGGDGTDPPEWGETPTPTVTPTATPTATPTVTPTAPTKPAVAEETPTKKKGIPGFTAVFVVAGLLAIAYLMLHAER